MYGFLSKRGDISFISPVVCFANDNRGNILSTILCCRVYSINWYTGVVALTDPAAVMQFNWHGRGVKLRKYALLTFDIPLISSLILIGLFLQIPKI